MSDAILCLNAGSSSVKFALFPFRRGGVMIARGQCDGIGSAPRLLAVDHRGNVLFEHHWRGEAATHETVVAELLQWIDGHLGGGRLAGVGHRIVHGGRLFSAPTRLDHDKLTQLEALTPLAPLHQPHNLAAVRAVMKRQPQLPQVGCFDTAFHAALPAVATRFALTAELEAQGVRRYGFHGLSYEYLARRLQVMDPPLARGRVIAAHLGAGASLCAMAAGRSVETTMGFSTLDGLMMATRCGALDPGVVLYLLRNGYDASKIEDLLYHRSGLLGVSAISGDMQALLASSSVEAKASIELFIYRLVRETGALASALGGLDGLVFTAGIGQNSPEIRALACARMAWLGVDLDAAANAANAAVISTPESAVKVRVTPTDEERMIAVHTRSVLRRGQARLGVAA